MSLSLMLTTSLLSHSSGFAVIFGAEGHLHGEGGDVVNYDDPAPLLRVLRYHPSAVFKVIDPQGLDHLSSSQWSTAAERVSDRH